MASQYRRTELMRQYAQLRLPGGCPSGIYISPLANFDEEWAGVIFVHKGLYASSILRFRIVFPAAFPAQAPSVFFEKNAIVHPLVDLTADRLALASRFPRWNPRTDNVTKLLFYIKSIFKCYNLRRLKEGHVVNVEAWRLFQHQPQVFARLASQCATVSTSSANLFRDDMGTEPSTRASKTADKEDDSLAHPLDFRPLDDSELELIRAQFLSL